MTKKPADPQAPNRILRSWPEIIECLGEFPAPEISIEYDTEEGGEDIEVKEWVFRGLADSCYELQPTIEREVKYKKGMEWPTLELLVLSEFKARARMHLSPHLIPDEKHVLTWLALMQHYGIPTRLLDFTYSPFLALYFAIRNGHGQCFQKASGRKYVRLWAVNAVEVNRRFAEVAGKVEMVNDMAWGAQPPPRVASIADDFVGQLEIMTTEMNLHERAARLLFATGKRSGVLKQEGCVCAVSSPAFNPRLVSQQGLFMFNCAESLWFQDSLEKMMSPCKKEWCKTFDIPVDLIPHIDIEGRLFQMNIHEQSVFPDLEGLAGMIRQKIRLHWK